MYVCILTCIVVVFVVMLTKFIRIYSFRIECQWSGWLPRLEANFYFVSHRPSILTHTHIQKPAFEDNNQFYTKAVNSSTREWKKTLLLRCVLLRFFNFFFKKIYSINIYVYVYAYACMCALKIFCVLFTVFISFFFEFFLTLLACFVLAAYIADRVSLLRLAFLL